MTARGNILFFSYARPDADFVLRLAQDLRAAGAEVWLDQLDIPAGAKWDEAVEEALHACGRLVVVLSPVSVASENVMDEVSFALQKGKQILPVLHQECEIPLRLHRLQHVDFREDYDRGLQKLLAALSSESEAAATDRDASSELRPDSRPTPTKPRIRKRHVAALTAFLVVVAGLVLGYAFFSPKVEVEPAVDQVHITLAIGEEVQLQAQALDAERGLLLEREILLVAIGEEVQLHAEALDAGGQPLLNREIQWTVDDASIASVSETGLVRTKRVGTAQVKATSEGKEGVFPISIEPSLVVEQRLTLPKTLTVTVANTGLGLILVSEVVVHWKRFECSDYRPPAATSVRVQHPFRVRLTASDGSYTLPNEFQYEPKEAEDLKIELGYASEPGVYSVWVSFGYHQADTKPKFKRKTEPVDIQRCERA